MNENITVCYDGLEEYYNAKLCVVYAVMDLVKNNIETTDENVSFYLESEDKKMALHVLKSTQNI
jgi:hypothetical protein